MDAFESWRVHENLKQWLGFGQLWHFGRLDLERDVRLTNTLFVRLVVVGAQGRPHDGEEAPQNAVFIRIRHRVERFLDRRDDVSFVVDALAGICRVKACVKQLHQLLRDRRVLCQCLLYVLLAEGEAGLFQIFCIGSQQQNFIGGERGGEGEAIEAIVFDFALPDKRKGRFKLHLDALQIEVSIGMREAEIVDMQWREIVARNDVGTLVLDINAHVFKHRQ